MCGRYTLVNLSQLTDLFPWVRDIPDSPPRYNIAPTQPILALPNDDQARFDFFHWGLIPSWAKDPAIGNQLINARAESLAQKNSFKGAYKRRRCLIPADGFYEWKKLEGSRTKQPLYLQMKSKRPFAFAGLWDTWESPDGSPVRSATIITTGPNDLMKSIHNRMPVILKPEHHKVWLDPAEKNADELNALLAPYPAEEMEAYPTSTQVNRPQSEGPDLIKPVEPKSATLFG